MSVDATIELPADPAHSGAPALPCVYDSSPEAAMSAGWERTKRVFDIVDATTMLLILGPLLAVIALAIILDSPGRVYFRQERYGRGRRPFIVLKFRSMHHGVSPTSHRLYIEHLATAPDDASGVLKKLTNDPRVTRVGAFLRRTSLDELPQLVNVLRGEMSIVGPRPALAYELEYYEPEHYARFGVRPGLTGLWQVSGRNEIDFLGMLSLDAQYARTASARTDAEILLRTPRALLAGNAA